MTATQDVLAGDGMPPETPLAAPVGDWGDDPACGRCGKPMPAVLAALEGWEVHPSCDWTHQTGSRDYRPPQVYRPRRSR